MVLARRKRSETLRLKLSLRTRTVLNAEQQSKLATLQRDGSRPRAIAPEQQELTAKMERVKTLIGRAKQEGRDLSATREMWRRVEQFTQQGQTAEACRVLDEAAQSLEKREGDATQGARTPQP